MSSLLQPADLPVWKPASELAWMIERVPSTGPASKLAVSWLRWPCFVASGHPSDLVCLPHRFGLLRALWPVAWATLMPFDLSALTWVAFEPAVLHFLQDLGSVEQ